MLKQVYRDISISQDGISAMDSFVIYTFDRIAAGVCQTLVPLSLVTIYFTRIELLQGEACVFYLDHKVPCKLQESCNQAEVESTWILTRPHSLPRKITSIVLGVICHSSGNREPENVILRQHIQRNLDMLLSDEPNALVIITGDFNHHTTRLKSKDISQANHLKQLVTFKTRDSGTLDWFFTNRPKLFSVSQLPKVASSDHYTILARPMLSSRHKPVIKIESRDMRDTAWRALGRWMTEKTGTRFLMMSLIKTSSGC